MSIDHRPFSLTLVVPLVAVEVIHVGRQATQLLRMGAPVVASRRTPDTPVAAAAVLPTSWLGDGCSAGLGVTDASGVGLAVTSGVVVVHRRGWDSDAVGVTEGSGDAVGLGDVASDADAVGVGETTGIGRCERG